MPAPLLVLASASPRRQQLLRQIGVEFELAPQHIDESPLPGEAPQALVRRLATTKAQSCLAQISEKGLVVLGSDTIVVHEDKILGQPRHQQDAEYMLKRLSGSRHQVLTAVTLASQQNLETCLSKTEVQFRQLSDKEIQSYWETGEPRGKAGAYGIQGLAAVFVESITGSYSGVMGLPLFETAQLLSAFGISCWQSVDGKSDE